MPENYTPAAAATGTWTEEEIRHQPRAWIRSLTNIDALRSRSEERRVGKECRSRWSPYH